MSRTLSTSGAYESCQIRAGAIRERLVRALQHASKRDLDDYRGRFIPRGALFSILSHQQVKEFLEAVRDHSDEDHPRLDTIASHISPKEGAACCCQDVLCTGGEPRFCDKALPFLDTPSNPRTEEHIPKAFKDMKPIEKELFHHVQWQMRSPYIKRLNPGEKRYEEPSAEVALPWIEFKRNTNLKDGEWSYVGKIQIDDEHHDLGQKGQNRDSFALKILQERRITGLTEKSFRLEVEANQRAPRHERIVPLLAAFKHRRKFYLVFPWADGGNLQEIWKKHSTFEGGDANAKFATWYSTEWLLKECCGIAEGLATTHGPSDVSSPSGKIEPSAQLHADIKPENILCFKTKLGESHSFTLKLADFGLAKKVVPGSPLEAGRVAHTKTYRPPEHDINEPVSLKYDVWCLGCLFLDFITWAILGWVGVEAFRESREGEDHDPEVTEAMGVFTEDTFFKKVAQHSPWFDYSGAKVKVGRAVEAEDGSLGKVVMKRYWLHFEHSSTKIRYSVKTKVNSKFARPS
ncbi:hypothetical protein DL767_005815 [Monosporascus sp. MG133]|nr:hypothetical protein DL767_005815 [Monosporascus sp. MG133]